MKCFIFDSVENFRAKARTRFLLIKFPFHRINILMSQFTGIHLSYHAKSINEWTWRHIQASYWLNARCTEWKKTCEEYFYAHKSKPTKFQHAQCTLKVMPGLYVISFAYSYSRQWISLWEMFWCSNFILYSYHEYVCKNLRECWQTIHLLLKTSSVSSGL